MVVGTWVQGLSLNESRRLADQWLRLKKCEGVSDNLIVVVNAGIDGSWQLGRQGRHAWPAAADHRSQPLSMLRSTKLDKVFTYDIVATRGT
jgi:hypothetical protein